MFLSTKTEKERIYQFFSSSTFFYSFSHRREENYFTKLRCLAQFCTQNSFTVNQILRLCLNNYIVVAVVFVRWFNNYLSCIALGEQWNSNNKCRMEWEWAQGGDKMIFLIWIKWWLKIGSTFSLFNWQPNQRTIIFSGVESLRNLLAKLFKLPSKWFWNRASTT